MTTNTATEALFHKGSGLQVVVGLGQSGLSVAVLVVISIPFIYWTNKIVSSILALSIVLIMAFYSELYAKRQGYN